MQSENKVRHKKIRRQFICLRIFHVCHRLCIRMRARKARGLCALQQGDVVGCAGLDHLLGPYARLYFADVRSAE